MVLASITPVFFSVTWFFRNNYNMLICSSINILYIVLLKNYWFLNKLKLYKLKYKTLIINIIECFWKLLTCLCNSYLKKERNVLLKLHFQQLCEFNSVSFLLLILIMYSLATSVHLWLAPIGSSLTPPVALPPSYLSDLWITSHGCRSGTSWDFIFQDHILSYQWVIKERLQ